jgi:hypothetical protein
MNATNKSVSACGAEVLEGELMNGTIVVITTIVKPNVLDAARNWSA